MKNKITVALTSLVIALGISTGVAVHEYNEEKAEKDDVKEELNVVVTDYDIANKQLAETEKELADTQKQLKEQKEANAKLAEKQKQTQSVVDKLSAELEEEKRKKQ